MLREVARIVPRNVPIVRDKSDVMTFTQWCNEKPSRSRTKNKIRSNLKHYIRSKRKKGSRIGTRKARYDFRISKSCAASNDPSYEHRKEDRSQTQTIRFDTDSLPIGVDV